MKIFIYSVKLWLTAVRAEACKQCFDRMVGRYIERSLPLSDKRITAMSHKCAVLRKNFCDEEQRLALIISHRKTEH